MAHPLEDVIRNAEPFVFIGNSTEGRFPAMSYANAKKRDHRIYYFDMGGMTKSRGKAPGGKVYADVATIPDDRTDLAVIWTKPRTAKRAVDIAHELGAKRVWFSFMTGHADAVRHARELGMEIVEIGRCPVHYMDGQVAECKSHTALLKISGAYKRPPQTDENAKRRELI